MDSNINNLPNYSAPSSASDVLPIVDITADSTKKITLTNLFAYLANFAQTLTNKTINGANNTLTVRAASDITGTLPIANGGTGDTTLAGAKIPVTDVANAFTASQTIPQVLSTNNAITATVNAATIPITYKVHTVTNNSAATLTITMTTTNAIDRQVAIVNILDFSAVAQTITWVNTENSTVTAPTTSNGSTTLPLTVGFMYNSATSKWRCLASS